jgi:hypothetical protein
MELGYYHLSVTSGFAACGVYLCVGLRLKPHRNLKILSVLVLLQLRRFFNPHRGQSLKGVTKG